MPTGVPAAPADLKMFTIHATSVLPGRLDWGFGRNISRDISESDLGLYLMHFSPSWPRHAYKLPAISLATAIHEYRHQTSNIVSKFTFKQLWNSLQTETIIHPDHFRNGVINTDMLHNLQNTYTISPSVTRDEMKIEFATRFTSHIFVRLWDFERQKEQQSLVSLFKSVAPIKSGAGAIFEIVVHRVLSCTHEWPIFPMKTHSRKSITITTPTSQASWTSFRSTVLLARSQAMVLTKVPTMTVRKPTAGDHPYDICRIWPSSSSDMTNLPDVAIPVISYRNLSHYTPLSEGYYIPDTGNYATFDSMLYNGAAKTAIVFQVTVSSLHGVSTKGIDVLQEHPDIQFIDYILVTPENVPPIKAKVEVPLAIANVIRRYYHLPSCFLCCKFFTAVLNRSLKCSRSKLHSARDPIRILRQMPATATGLSIDEGGPSFA